MNARIPNPNPVTRLGTAQRKRLLMWLMLSVLAALVGWIGFRGYLNPDLLFHFANSLYC
jgi:hypothetical protein